MHDLYWQYQRCLAALPKIRPCIHPYFYFEGIMVYSLHFLAVMHSNLHPFLSHSNSQNNGGGTLHIALKFPTKCLATLHHCNKPIKGGYTIKILNGVPYFRTGKQTNLIDVEDTEIRNWIIF